MNRRFTRRSLLRGLGAAAAAAPFLPLMHASGEGPVPPKRLVLFFTPHGTVWDNWSPSGGETDFVLSPILEPLERHRSKIVILDGIGVRADGVGAPHTKGPPLLWTASPLIEDMTFTREDGSGGRYFGWNSAASFDQVLAPELSAGLPYRSLEFGVRVTGGSFPGTRMIYAGAERPIAPQQDPWAMFDTLFMGATATMEEAARVRAERRSVLDVVKGQLDTVRGRVAESDRGKIDAHLQAVRDIETALSADAARCVTPELGGRVDPAAVANVPAVFDRQIEMLGAAFACDLTRVASLQYRVGENDGMLYPWLGLTRLEHHQTSHETTSTAYADLTTVYNWYTQKFAKLLDELAARPEPRPDGSMGTMLDNTLVIWGSEVGTGYTHDFAKVPFVLAGGAGGAIRTGRYLRYTDTWHNRLLVSAFHAMGRTDVSTFGATDRETGPLARL